MHSRTNEQIAISTNYERSRKRQNWRALKIQLTVQLSIETDGNNKNKKTFKSNGREKKTTNR